VFAPPPNLNELPPQRFIPPNIVALLHDPRVDVVTRAYLLGMAGKKTEDWTLADLRMVTVLVPVLTEMHIGTAMLSEFYTFMGLDPNSLFEPQLGAGWQTSSTALDPKRFGTMRRTCTMLSRQARIDPEAVKVQELVNCADENN
jgi:hypothetical protein